MKKLEVNLTDFDKEYVKTKGVIYYTESLGNQFKIYYDFKEKKFLGVNIEDPNDIREIVDKIEEEEKEE